MKNIFLGNIFPLTQDTNKLFHDSIEQTLILAPSHCFHDKTSSILILPQEVFNRQFARNSINLPHNQL